MSTDRPRIVILGERSSALPNHRFTDAALGHSAAVKGLDVVSEWISPSDITDAILKRSDGLWVTSGGVYAHPEGAFAAIRAARTSDLPCLGTCGGFQHMVVEYARNVLALEEAQHAEYDDDAPVQVISKLTCSLVGQTFAITLVPGSRVAALYRSRLVEERYSCSFGINPKYAARFQAGPFRPVGVDSQGEIRAMEISDHPFYVGTLYVPQARSTPEIPHPLVSGFLAAASAHALARRERRPE